MKKMMLIGMVVVMMLGLVGCNSEEKEIVEKIQSEETEGFTPIQVEEESQEVADVVEEVIISEDLSKYYDTTQYTGVARLETLMVIQCKIENETCLVNENNASLSIVYNEELENHEKYDCIIVDNNTPEDISDDIVVYIFAE